VLRGTPAGDWGGVNFTTAAFAKDLVSILGAEEIRPVEGIDDFGGLAGDAK
jgi:hypothetical protein